MAPNVRIEPFRGDYENLERMAHVSWRDEYGDASFPNFYRPAFLRYMFERVKPGERDHVIGAYVGDEIVGFLGNVPQKFHFRGQTFRATYSCLLVIRRDMLRKGLATAMIQEAVRLNQKYKYDFSLFGLETGHRSTLMMEKFKREGIRVERVKTFRVIARVLDLNRVASSEGLKRWERAAIVALGAHRPPKASSRLALRPYRPDDLAGCLELLDRYRQSVDLALLWERDDLGWELECPGVVQTLVCERDGRILGLINFIYHDHLGRTKERWAWVHHLAYPDLSGNEQADFVRAFLSYVRDKGCLGAIEWTRGAYPQRPFYRARFFPYFRAVNLCSWTFNPAISLGNLGSVYEIQV